MEDDRHSVIISASFSPPENQALAAFSNKESVQKEVKATLSQKATLSCNVSDSKTEVKWYKDGKLLISSRTIYSEVKGNTRQLVIEKVEKSDAGEYTCEAGVDKIVFKIFVSGRSIIDWCTEIFTIDLKSATFHYMT